LSVINFVATSNQWKS